MTRLVKRHPKDIGCCAGKRWRLQYLVPHPYEQVRVKKNGANKIGKDTAGEDCVFHKWAIAPSSLQQ